MNNKIRNIEIIYYLLMLYNLQVDLKDTQVEEEEVNTPMLINDHV